MKLLGLLSQNSFQMQAVVSSLMNLSSIRGEEFVNHLKEFLSFKEGFSFVKT